jgi:hypothetical protein
MQTLIKRFSGNATDLNLVLLSLTAAVLSLQLTFLPPLGQFIATSTVLIAEVMFLIHLLADTDYFSTCLNIIHVAAVLVLSSTGVFELFAVFSILSIFLESGKDSMYLKAFNAHLADAAATFIAVPALKESNPVMGVLIKNIGILPAILISKIGLISLALAYAYRNLDHSEAFFLKTVAVLGFSMAARNFILIL